MIDISTEGILFLGEVEKHRLKKLVTCDWEVLPMTGHQFFYGSCYSGAAFGACCPLIACERGGAGSEGSNQFSYSRLAVF